MSRWQDVAVVLARHGALWLPVSFDNQPVLAASGLTLAQVLRGLGCTRWDIASFQTEAGESSVTVQLSCELPAGA